MAKGTFVDATHLPGLQNVLKRWVAQMCDDGWGSGDAPWWYGERASVSQLAGAIWGTRGGWAMEEYAASRKLEPGTRKPGRGDLALEANGLKLVCESKQIWPRLVSSLDVAQGIETAMKAATKQVLQLPNAAGKYGRAAVVFVAPRVAPRIAKNPAVYEDRLTLLCQQLQEVPDTSIAYAFPSWARQLASKKAGRYRYPGCALLVRRVE